MSEVGLSEGILIIMGREPNFSELRDAIRQGQAKIAQGLKSGQMCSGRDPNATSRPRLDPAHEVLGKKPGLTAQSTLFQKSRKPKFKFRLPAMPNWRFRLPKLPSMTLPPLRPVAMGVGSVLAVGLVVLVLFWVGKALFSRSEPLPVVGADAPQVVAPVTPPMPAPTPPPARPAPVRQAPTPVEPTRPAAPVAPPAAAAPIRTGDNVIVIQGIVASREGELRPVQEFFARYGIATEIIRGGNNYSQLVTVDRFENPNRPGADGYEVRNRIRDIGKRYPAETGDTKFGAEPFQDAYGLLRQ